MAAHIRLVSDVALLREAVMAFVSIAILLLPGQLPAVTPVSRISANMRARFRYAVRISAPSNTPRRDRPRVVGNEAIRETNPYAIVVRQFRKVQFIAAARCHRNREPTRL